MEFVIAFAVSLAVSALAYVIGPKPPKPPDATAGAIDIPEPKLGTPISVIFGEVWMDNPSITYYGNATTTPIKTKGGKK